MIVQAKSVLINTGVCQLSTPFLLSRLFWPAPGHCGKAGDSLNLRAGDSLNLRAGDSLNLRGYLVLCLLNVMNGATAAFCTGCSSLH